MIATKKILYFPQSPRGRDIQCHGGTTWGNTSVSHEAEVRGNGDKNLYCGFHKGVLARQNKQAYDWLG